MLRALARTASALHPAPEPRRTAPIWRNKQGIFMSSTTHALNDSHSPVAEPAHRGTIRSGFAVLAIVSVVAACGVDNAVPGDAVAPCMPPASGSAPTYTELYTRYFAPNTPGHCATTDCHLDGVQGWACGLNKATCYKGMVDIGLINPSAPTTSLLGDPKRSLLSWVNPFGSMPQDAVGPFPEGRDAILAWVAACAQND
jgi:hypothetical protein